MRAAAGSEREWSVGAVLAERPIDLRTHLLVVRADAGLAAALDLRRRLVGLRLAGNTTILVDVEGSQRVSDAVLAALMHGRRRLESRNGRLLAASESPAIRALLERAGLEVVDWLENE